MSPRGEGGHAEKAATRRRRPREEIPELTRAGNQLIPGGIGAGWSNGGMLCKESLDEYRRMKPTDRLRLPLRMTEENLAALVAGSPETVARRFEILLRKTTFAM